MFVGPYEADYFPVQFRMLRKGSYLASVAWLKTVTGHTDQTERLLARSEQSFDIGLGDIPD